MHDSPTPTPWRRGRYADALKRAGQRAADVARTPVHAPQIVVWGHGHDRADDLIPEEIEPRSTRSRVLMVVLGQALAIVGALLAILAYHLLDIDVASDVVISVAILGLIAVVRRVPLALWCTLGVVFGGALGRWS